MGRIVIFSRCRTMGIFNVSKRWFQMHSVQGPSIDDVDGVKQELYGKLAREKIRLGQQFQIPKINNPEVRTKRSAMFSNEQQRQFSEVGRVEKIQVEYQGLPSNTSLLMNKNISTPFNCGQHMGEMLTERSVVAEVNGQLWDMHRPIENDCTLKLLHFKLKDDEIFQVNRVFWRSCSFMLGCIMEQALKDHIYVELHSFPSPNVRSGSFLYDVDLKLKDWKPNSDEMRVLSAELIKLSRKQLAFERLEVSTELALQMFEDNKYKREQIPEIAQGSHDEKSVCLYRIGDFVDISRGPMMSNTNQLGKCTVTAVHHLPQLKEISETIYRIQGIALPMGFLLNHFAYGLIEERGRKMNTTRLPGTKFADQFATNDRISSENVDETKQAALG